MQEKATLPLPLLNSELSTPVISAWFEIVHLKQLFRQGWLQRGMPTEICETVAEHTFGNAMLCLMMLPRFPELDPLRVLRMALVHDIGEAYVGDITPQDNVDRADKIRMETEAVHKIFAKLDGGAELISDWEAYERQESPEARFVKQMDRLELALQAAVYDHQGKVDADEFIRAAERGAEAGPVAEELEALRRLLK